MSELLALLALIKSATLIKLRAALEANEVIRGRFYDYSENRGCLVYWLSEHEVQDRPLRDYWISRISKGMDHAAIRKLVAQVISNWDALAEHISKGFDYDKEYPLPNCELTSDDVKAAIDSVLHKRDSRRKRSRRRPRLAVVA